MVFANVEEREAALLTFYVAHQEFNFGNWFCILGLLLGIFVLVLFKFKLKISLSLV